MRQAWINFGRAGLGDAVPGLDRKHLDLVLAAIAQPGGSNQHSDIRMSPRAHVIVSGLLNLTSEGSGAVDRDRTRSQRNRPRYANAKVNRAQRQQPGAGQTGRFQEPGALANQSGQSSPQEDPWATPQAR